jgi:hypothetical protein
MVLVYIGESQSEINLQNSQLYINTVERRIQDMYLQEAQAAMENNRKLEEYILLKNNYSYYETFLSNITEV